MSEDRADGPPSFPHASGLDPDRLRRAVDHGVDRTEPRGDAVAQGAVWVVCARCNQCWPVCDIPTSLEKAVAALAANVACPDCGSPTDIADQAGGRLLERLRRPDPASGWPEPKRANGRRP